MKKTLGVVAVLLAFSLGAFAQFTGPAFPPPGGVTFTGSGPGSGTAGGKTFSYSNFNPSAYGQLYYGNVDAANVWSSQFGPSGNMVFGGFGPNGELLFNSTSPFLFNTLQGNVSVSTQLIMQFQNFTGTNVGFESSGFLVPTATAGGLGIGGEPASDPMYLVTGNFQVHFEFFATCGSGTACPGVTDYFNSFNNFSDTVNTSVNQGFWASAPTSDTPEPGGLALLGTGLLGLGGAIRRKFYR